MSPAGSVPGRSVEIGNKKVPFERNQNEMELLIKVVYIYILYNKIKNL